MGFRKKTTGAGLHPQFTQFSAPHPRDALHCKEEEFYVCIYATREGDYILFHHEGGVDVGDVDTKAQKLLVGVDEKLDPEDIKKHLLVHAPGNKKELSERVCREVAEGAGEANRLRAQSRESRVVSLSGQEVGSQQ